MCSAHRDRNRTSDPLDLELQEVVSAMWVLGMNLAPLEEQSVSLITIELSLQL